MLAKTGGAVLIAFVVTFGIWMLFEIVLPGHPLPIGALAFVLIMTMAVQGIVHYLGAAKPNPEKESK